ncbi:hypothetical protein AC1031_009301 [Aphanomyces cochlioides]|nr:hypothetical protein AC1031_009301 [Aphanomyces cochlioides]
MSAGSFMSDINEEMLRQFEEEFEAQRMKVEQARDAVKHKKSLAVQARIEMAQTTLQQLDGQVLDARETRKSLRQRLNDKRSRLKQVAVDQQELKRNTWHIERAHQLEDAAQRRLELERIQNERTRVESMLTLASMQLDEIEAERKRRNETGIEAMQRLMNRGTVLKQQLNEGQLNVPELHSVLDTEGHEQFIEECHGLRRVQAEQQHMKLQEKMQQLNAERKKLADLEDDLHRRELALTGQTGAQTANYTKLDDNIDDVIALATKLLDAGINMTADSSCHAPIILASPGDYLYDGALGEQSYAPWQLPTRKFVSELVLELISNLPIESLRDLKAARRQWRATEKRLARAHRRRVNDEAVLAFHSSLMTDVVDEMLRDIFADLESIYRRMTSLVTQSILQTLVVPNRPLLESSFHELRRRRSRSDNAVLDDFFPRHQITQKLVKLNSGVSPPKKSRWRFGNTTAEPAKSSAESNILPTTRPVHLDKLEYKASPPALIALEAAYWSHITLTSKAVTLPIAASCVYLDENTLFVGGSKGELVIFDMASLTARHQRLDPPPPSLAATSFSVFSKHVLATSPGTLSFWTTRRLKDSQSTLAVVFHLSNRDLDHSEGFSKDDTISVGNFAPGISLGGTPTGLLVGTERGSIVRLHRSPEECQPICGYPLTSSKRQERLHYHRTAVVYLGMIAPRRVVSVDKSGVVCLWNLNEMTGFGWFEPDDSLQLQGRGVVHQAQHTHDRLVILVFDESKGEGQVVQVTWNYVLAVVPVSLRIGCAAPPPLFAILPRVQGFPGEYVALMATTLTIYSLTTGKAVGVVPPECKYVAVSVSAGPGYIVGCGRGKVIAFAIQDNSPQQVVHTAQKQWTASVGPITLSTSTSRCIERVEVKADRAMIRTLAYQLIHSIVDQLIKL